MEKHENYPLKEMNTFGFDVRTRGLITFDNPGELRELYDGGFFRREKWRVLGGGSNVLFRSDYDGVLLHPTNAGIEPTGGSTVRVHAGTVWDDFVSWCVGRGLWGVENLSLIPGQAGAAPVQNIGAYGAEIKRVIESVEVFMTDTGKTTSLSAAECRFGYRDSIFKGELRDKAIITALNLRLSAEPAPNIRFGEIMEMVEAMGGQTLENIREAVIAIRRQKLPDFRVLGNAGSFFKNPIVDEPLAGALKEKYPDLPAYPAVGGVKLSAAWLIERAGWKGYRGGNVGVHLNQPLVLLNTGGATGDEILELAAALQADLMEKFGVKIEMEVNILP